MNQNQRESEFHLSLPDIERAVRHEIISKEDADRLVKWAYDQRFDPLPADFEADRPTEQPKGFNLVTVAYYFGAMLMISACAWFLGDK